MHDTILTVDEVGTILRFSRQTIYALCKEGKIPHFKVGNKLRFKAVDINAMTNTEVKPQGEVNE
jgi:excisionase family DNA binding protein